MPNFNAALTARKQGASITEVNPARPSGSIGPGNIAQFGGGNSAAEVAATQDNILPAGPGWRIQGTDSGGAQNNNIIGTVPPGKVGLPQISVIKQNATDLKVGNAAVAGSSNYPDNWLPSTSSQGVPPAVNTTQDPQQGLSMGPQTE